MHFVNIGDWPSWTISEALRLGEGLSQSLDPGQCCLGSSTLPPPLGGWGGTQLWLASARHIHVTRHRRASVALFVSACIGIPF